MAPVSEMDTGSETTLCTPGSSGALHSIPVDADGNYVDKRIPPLIRKGEKGVFQVERKFPK